MPMTFPLWRKLLYPSIEVIQSYHGLGQLIQVDVYEYLGLEAIHRNNPIRAILGDYINFTCLAHSKNL